MVEKACSGRQRPPVEGYGETSQTLLARVSGTLVRATPPPECCSWLAAPNGPSSGVFRLVIASQIRNYSRGGKPSNTSTFRARAEWPRRVEVPGTGVPVWVGSVDLEPVVMRRRRSLPGLVISSLEVPGDPYAAVNEEQYAGVFSFRMIGDTLQRSCSVSGRRTPVIASQ
jgi:hypothetical protein